MMPTLVADGQGGLAALTKAEENGEPFQLILTDMHMPKMDGIQFIEHIRSKDSSMLATIMMLSSSGHRGDAVRCEELGVASYLLKPIRQAELREAIARVLGAVAEHREEPILTKDTLESDKMHAVLDVLLAEDNAVNQKLAKVLLEKRGHKVTLAGNGREALEALQQSHFDLVLMDVQMPEMDGITATMALRNREQQTGRHQAVIAMTALAMKSDRERCLEAGMDGYLAKPIRAHELDEILEKYSARKTQDSVVHVSNSNGSTGSGDRAIDVDDLLERVGNDRDFLAELIAVFREDHLNQLEQIVNGLEKNDLNEIRRGAHSLKGALANLAAPAASDLAARLEDQGTSGDLTEAGTTFKDLKIELNRVLSALHALTQETAR
jgi:CheY-like chemotaxis protein